MSVEVIETTDGRASEAMSEKEGSVMDVVRPDGLFVTFCAELTGVQFVELASTTPKMTAPAISAKNES
jgi:hypothetical protein